MNVWSELKRRNVFRVGAAYLVSAWLLIEIADILFPALGFPKFALQLLIVLLALGLVPVMMLAWAYELTAAGFVRDRGPDAEGAENRNTGRRLDQVTIAMILLALGVVAAERFVVPKGAVPQPSVTTPTEAPPVATLEPAIPPEPATPAPRESVAVLPFANMSPDPENEFFADGIAEELLNVLSGIEGLKVASRTSAFSFKGRQTSIRDIARTLNVAHVLEGSVRKQGLKVRITAQLIDAENDKHLWAETYDRDLDDIFAVQEEIARAISTALGGALGFSGDARKVEVTAPTDDLQAYELYLRARQLFYQRGEALLTARKLLDDAVARDAAFAEAWALLAAVHFVSPDYVGVPKRESLDAALVAAEKAMTLDDGLALPYAVMAQIKAERGDRIAREAHLGEAIKRDPRDSTAWLWRGIHYLEVGDLARAEQDLERANEIDPLTGITHGWLATARGKAGDIAAAEAGLKRAFDLGWSAAGWNHMSFALASGDRARAIADLQSYVGRFPEQAPTTADAFKAAYATIQDPANSAALIEAVRADTRGVNGTGWSATLSVLGLHREALEVELDPRLPRGSTYLFREMWSPPARGVLDEPAFLEVAERDGLMAYWKAKGFPQGCTLVESAPRHLDCTERWK